MGLDKWEFPESGKRTELTNNQIMVLLSILVLFIIVGITFCIAFGD